jgi:hypothetical protein
MLSALVSFFGGSIFRMLWGEVSSWLTKRQDHSQEMERMELQERLDASAHARQMESIKQQADQQIKVIEVAAQGQVEQIETQAWLEAVKLTGLRTGIWFVDAWNAVIRPGVATWSVVMITGNYCGWWVLDGNAWSICGAALGIYLADRSLFKRGK